MECQRKNSLYIFRNLKSSSWHFLRLSSKTKNKFRFSQDLDKLLEKYLISKEFLECFNALAIFLAIYQSQSKHSRLVLQKIRRESLFFTTKPPGVPGTHFIESERVKG